MRVQFEVISMSGRNLIAEYKKLLAITKLKAEVSLIYQCSEIYIITSSQRTIEKVNKILKSKFNFNFGIDHIYRWYVS